MSPWGLWGIRREGDKNGGERSELLNVFLFFHLHIFRKNINNIIKANKSLTNQKLSTDFRFPMLFNSFKHVLRVLRTLKPA